MIKLSKPKKIPAISWSWQEGRYWDLWMIVHMFTGTICACAVALIALPPFLAYLLVLLALTAYELAEMAFGIVEEMENWILDVAFGMFGFWFVYQKVIPGMSFSDVVGIGIFLLLFNGLFSFLGWRAYRKRSR